MTKLFYFLSDTPLFAMVSIRLLVSFIIISISASQDILNIKVNINRRAKQSLGYTEDSYLNFTELATKYGYLAEEHFVTTEDGYILRLFRIPQRLNRTGQSLGTPVMAVHGLVESADSWIFTGPGYSLGYQMVDAGYDMWFTNYRGNIYSRNHTTLDPDKNVKFWKFGSDEIAEFDLPAIIDYILKVRGLASLNYIGFSQGPDYSLGYQMVDAGYDMWFTNYRGNIYSRNHSKLDPDKDVHFWKFGSDEIAEFDVPAIIDYILNVRGLASLNYIGFSQGTTVFYKMGAFKPDYYNKVNLMISLAPVAYMKHTYNPFIRVLLNILPELEKAANLIGLQELFPRKSTFFESLTYFCHFIKVTFSVCSSIIFGTGGGDYEQVRAELLPLTFGHFTGGVSLQNLIELGQGIQNNDFRRYNHGRKGNLVAYGSPLPPKYNVSLVTTPVALFIGKNDWLSSESDVARLRKELPNVVEYYVVPKKRWGHFDFFLAKDAVSLIGKKILRLLKIYI